MNMDFLALIILSYLTGSIPFGLLMTMAHGIDLRNIGSGNIGATNVSRALGKRWAYCCFLLDCLKGFVPMFIAGLLIKDITVIKLSLWLGVGCAAILGHIFPIYLNFKGGKGMSTCLGVILGLYPYYTIPGLIAFAVWGICVLIWRYISLASMIAAVSFPLTLTIAFIVSPQWHFKDLWPLFIVAIAVPILIVVRHVENITRLLDGSENKVMQKKSKSI
ncbi:MAG: glycerol-3-phosphate 1-O-acyltransferase PlsY [Sedimentisphaerales bacterium]|nr:glycerol-3-phosphate 1-O-acyltransferase PlsY [Sedimentisphaerales bacterium]